MPEPIELVLSAQPTRFVEGIKIGAQALEGLRQVAARVQAAVAQSLVGVSAAGKNLGESLRATLRGLGAGTSEAVTDLRGFTSDVQDAFRGAADVVEGSAERIGKAADGVAEGVGKAADAAGGAGEEIEKGFGSIGEAVEAGAEKLEEGILNIRTAVAALGAGALLKKAVQETADFGQAIAYVGTVLDDKAAVPLERYKSQLLALAGRTTQDAVERTRTLYQILSSGIPATEGAAGASETLETTLRAATAGMANAEEAAKAITGTMNAYGESNVTAAEASDVLFQTVNRGVVEFPQLAQLFGQVSGVAASLGVKLPEVGAAIATITKAGIPAESAVSGLRQAILAIAKPPEEVKKALKSLGLEFGTTALAEKGFAGILAEVAEKTGGSSEALTKLFTDVDGLKAVLALTRGGMQGFRDDITALADSAGSTDRAFGLLSQTFSFQADVLKNRVQALLIGIGERVLPRLQAAFAKLGAFVAENGDRIADAVGGFFDALVSVGTWVAANGQRILTFVVAFFATSRIAAATIALRKFVIDFIAGIAASAAAAQAAGAAAAAGATTGFGRVAAGVGGLLINTFKGLAKSPTLLGAVVAVGIALGGAIVQAFEDKFDEQFTEAKKRFTARFAELIAPIVQLQTQFNQGNLVSFAKGGKFEKSSVFSVEQARKAGIEDQAILNAAIEVEATLRREAATAAAKVRLAEEGLAKAVRLRAAAEEDGNEEVARGAQEAVDVLKERIEGLRALRDEQQAGADSVVTNTEAQIRGLNAAKAAEDAEGRKRKGAADKLAGSSGAADAEKLAKRREAIAEEIARASTASAGQQLANERELLGAEIETNARRLDDQMETAKAAGASEEQLLAIRRRAITEANGLFQSQVEAARAAADAEVEVARAATQKRLDNFKDSAEAQRAIAEELTADEEAIRLKADAEVNKIQRARAKATADIVRAQLDAVLARGAEGLADEFAADDRKAKPTSLVDDTKAAVKVLADPLGEIAEKGGLIAGTVAGLALVVRDLPAIFRGLAGFFRDGLADFIGELGASAGDLVLAVLEGFPDQLDRIFAEVIPKIIENAIANLPRVVAAWITMAPRVVYAIVHGIYVGLPTAIVRGVARAFGNVFDFFSSRAVERIVGGIGRAFATAGVAIYNGIKEAFLWIIQKIKAALDATGGAIGKAGSLASGFIDAIPGGKLLRTNVLKKIPLVGGFFGHTGGAVRGSAVDAHGALALAAAGAARFAAGGLVQAPGTLARARLRAVLAGDDVPSVLQAGEIVLNRTGARQLGEDRAAALNRGQEPSGLSGPLQASVSLIGRSAAPLLQMLLASVAVDISSPGGVTRRAVHKRVSRAPLMVRAVRGRA